MATPSPVFPAAVATDAQLKVANNLIQTTLKVAIDGTNLALFVASTAGFTPNCLVSIDKEILAVESVTNAPDPVLTVAAGGRGFDGTAAASHGAGAKVAMLIDAWHHNALAAEVKAIEAFMGPNGQNIALASSHLIWAANYQFTRQPGGTLAPGNNAITLSPVPAGVNGSDTQHYLYISGGTGASEAVLITGGSAVAGDPSGQIIVNCANAHSGAWTIQTATAGMQEAVNTLPSNGGGRVGLLAGTSTVYAPTTIAKNGVTIQGQGTGFRSNVENNAGPDLIGTRIKVADGANLDAVLLATGSNFTAQDFEIWGNKQNQSAGTGDAIRIQQLTGGLPASIQLHRLAHLTITEVRGKGIYIQNAGLNEAGIIDNVVIRNSGNTNCQIEGNDWVLLGCNFGGTGNANTYNLAILGRRINMFGGELDYAQSHGILITGFTGSHDNIISGVTIDHSGQAGIYITAGAKNTLITGNSIQDSSNQSAGSYAGIHLSSDVSGTVITGNRIYNYNTSNSPYALNFETSAASGSAPVVVTGNNFAGNTAGPIYNVSLITNLILSNNGGIDDAFPTVASAASITAPFGPMLFVSGTTQIGAITNGWGPRTITLIFTNASPGGLVAGGNIARTQTAVQNQRIMLTFDPVSAKWY